MDDAATLIGLVERYSPSGQERGAADWLVARMRALHFSRSFVDEAGNAVGVMGDGPQQVVLLGHIDTVPGEIPVRVEEDILYARGAVDAKGPLACFVDAVSRLGPVEGWQFVVVGAVEEERDSEAAVEMWLRINKWSDEFNGGRERAFDRLLLTLRGMESGGDGFEEWARLRIGARLPVDLDPPAWFERLQQLADGAQMERLGFPIPAYQCEKNTPLVRAFLGGIRAAGGTPSFVYKTGTADLNIVVPAWNCPALVYGPGDSALDHTPNEHISLGEYEKSVGVLMTALEKLTS
jgi:LysW-gamma-L-lysine carboxypeptidase